MPLKRKNDGFSLVELIIVIAIMAVLIGLLAPQFLRFAMNSRVMTDVDNANSIAKCIDAAIAEQAGDPVAHSITGAGGTEVESVKGLEKLPPSKVDASYVWKIESDIDQGVTKITLNNFQIYPGDLDSNAYYQEYYTE